MQGKKRQLEELNAQQRDAAANLLQAALDRYNQSWLKQPTQDLEHEIARTSWLIACAQGSLN